MFGDFHKYAWGLKEYRYESLNALIAALDGTLIPKVLEIEQELAKLRQRDDWPTENTCAPTDDDKNR